MAEMEDGPTRRRDGVEAPGGEGGEGAGGARERGPEAYTPWLSRFVAAALLLWIVSAAVAGYASAWLTASLARGTAGALPPVCGPLPGLVVGGLVVFPAAALWRWWQDGPATAGYRRIFGLWALAGLYAMILAPAKVPGPLAAPLGWLLQIGLSLTFAVVLLVVRGRAREGVAESGAVTTKVGGALWVLALALLAALPWVVRGTLGSPLDTALALGGGLAVGVAAGVLLGRFGPSGDEGAGPAARLGYAAVVAGALLVVGGSAGFGGLELLLMPLLAALGPAAVAVRSDRRWQAPTLLVGVTAAAVMAFVDPREVATLLSFGLFEMAVLLAPTLAAAIALALFGGLLLLAVRWGVQPAGTIVWRRGGAFAAATLVLLTVVAYIFAGRPGFYGEELFVILEEQAVLEGVEGLEESDVVARRALVYDALVAHANASQADLRRVLERARVPHRPYYLVNGLAVEGGPLLRLWLASRPEVARVLHNPTLRPLLPEQATAPDRTPPAAPPWNLEAIGAPRVWAELGVRGAGVVVGESDSGVQWDHPELIDGYRGGPGDHDFNWFDPWLGTAAPVDYSGHGTHTLGTVLGESVGVAPDATWYGCANLARNLGNTALYLDCMQFMLAPFPQGGDPFTDGEPALGANVLNNSWGCPPLEGCDALVLRPAVAALRAAGTFVVVSAGNDGPECGSLNAPPAIYDEVVSVGAVTPEGDLVFFSSRGPAPEDVGGLTKPDLVAPGTEILSAFPGDSYEQLEGTSMAGPHVAGVVALMWSANPALIGDVGTTEAILFETARVEETEFLLCDSEESLPLNTVGYGLVDAYGAVQAALNR